MILTLVLVHLKRSVTTWIPRLVNKQVKKDPVDVVYTHVR